LVNVPELIVICWVVQVSVSGDPGADAPGPPPVVEPYVMLNVPPELSVTPETVMVWPETDTVPVVAVVYPEALPVTEGVPQSAGTARVTAPLLIPPVAAV
jgi:hypothetical protein